MTARRIHGFSSPPSVADNKSSQISAALRQWLPSSRYRDKVVTLQRVCSPTPCKDYCDERGEAHSRVCTANIYSLRTRLVDNAMSTNMSVRWSQFIIVTYNLCRTRFLRFSNMYNTQIMNFTVYLFFFIFSFRYARSGSVFISFLYFFLSFVLSCSCKPHGNLNANCC